MTSGVPGHDFSMGGQDQDLHLVAGEMGKSFETKSELRVHEDTHIFMCKFCGRFFTTTVSLEQHKLVHGIQLSVGGPGQGLETKAVECHLSPASGSSDNGVDGSVAGESSQLLLFFVL